jgi:hypothetical protein
MEKITSGLLLSKPWLSITGPAIHTNTIFSPGQLRKGRINLMIDGISGIINRLFANHNQLLATLQSLNEQAKDTEIKEKLESSLKIIRQDVEYVSDTLSGFKVGVEKPEIRKLFLRSEQVATTGVITL